MLVFCSKNPTKTNIMIRPLCFPNHTTPRLLISITMIVVGAYRLYVFRMSNLVAQERKTAFIAIRN